MVLDATLLVNVIGLPIAIALLFLVIYANKKRRVLNPPYDYSGVVSVHPAVFGSDVSA